MYGYCQLSFLCKIYSFIFKEGLVVFFIFKGHAMKYRTFLTSLLFLMFSCSASAASLSDIDKSALSFEVDSLASNTTATGTSNGIGYTLTMNGGAYYTPFSNTTSSQTYNDLPGSYDDLHLNGNFTITFDEKIDSLLFAFANNNASGDGPDFGLIPDDFTGITLNGTEISITDIRGALALFVFDSPVTSISSVNWGVSDGWDVSFFAYKDLQRPSEVPVPAAIFLFAPALLGLMGFHRKLHPTA